MSTDIAEDSIVAELVQRLSHLARGARAPSETDIMAEFDVPRSRARAVLKRLEQAWLLRRVQGSGTFVIRQVDYPVSLESPASLHEILASAGVDVRTVMLGVDTELATPGVAEWLHVEPHTEIRRVRRLGYLDDGVAMVLDEYLAPGRLEQVSVALPIFESMAELLRTEGCVPTRTAGRGTLAVPPCDVAQRLDVPSATPAWRLETQLRDGVDGPVLLVSRAWSRLDVVRIVFEFGQVNRG